MRDLSSWKVLIAAITVAVSLSAGCAKTITDALDDTTITTRVKTAMLNDPVIGALPIDVATTRSVVTLSGRVKSQTERDQALALARQVSGVSEVKDALQIVPAAQ
jgi:osmotically-inducible protein OsmY